MSTDTQLRLASTRKGRVLMHALAMALDWRISWHARGIWHELARRGKANPLAA